MIGWITIIGRGSDNGCLRNLCGRWDKNGINFISLNITFVAVIGAHIFFLRMEHTEGIGGKMDCSLMFCFKFSNLLNGYTVFGALKSPMKTKGSLLGCRRICSPICRTLFSRFFRTIVQVAVVSMDDMSGFFFNQTGIGKNPQMVVSPG